ncbi:hypothetical protein TNCV_2019041 [Trichonephila clavipes]|nr:hypothetical protein TNCV_2019041 [Trichonephila clavipes]
MIIIDLLIQVLPAHEPHDVPWFEPYSYFEPADLDSDYIEQEAAKGKGGFIQALWTQYAIPKLYGVSGRNGPIAYFKCQNRVRFSSERCTGQKRRSVVVRFTCVASYDTWT